MGKKLTEAYRKMANDSERESDAADWIEGVATDGFRENLNGWLQRLDELSSEPFPSIQQPRLAGKKRVKRPGRLRNRLGAR